MDLDVFLELTVGPAVIQRARLDRPLKTSPGLSIPIAEECLRREFQLVLSDPGLGGTNPNCAHSLPAS